jgi:predicted GIY-YIG superfamily endonuclease
MSFFVYLLHSSASSGQQTYVGATVDLDHRLRQHNKEIKGGAVATSVQVEKGNTWERVCHVTGFPTWQAALQFEWRFKQLSRKLPARMDPLERRISGLCTLIGLERSTSKAVPYAEWPTPMRVMVESDKIWHMTTQELPFICSSTSSTTGR